MADFASTKKNATFDQWFEQLQLMTEIWGDYVGDQDDWFQTYEAGMAVEAAYYEEFGGDDD